MTFKENLRNITDESRRMVFEIKYEKQLSAMKTAAKNGDNFIVFDNNKELSTLFVKWLFDEKFKVYGESHEIRDWWTPITNDEWEDFLIYHRIKVEW